MITSTQILESALKRIKTRGWTQKAYARDKHGRSLSSSCYEGAESYCILGAMHAASMEFDTKTGFMEALLEAKQRLRAVINAEKQESIWLWNDASGRTRTDVVTMLERALAR